MKSFFVFFFSLFIFHCNAQLVQNYSVAGESRKAIVYPPFVKTDKKNPVVFVFHGRGGNATFASRKMNFQDYYKEAVIVFMEGIPGRKISLYDPSGRKNGWQIFPDQVKDADILFFDTVLNDLHQKYSIDDSRIYLVGHSNGARFAHVLWKERGNLLAGIISVSAQGGEMVKDAVPVSVWMYMGKNDKVVPFENQKESVPIVMNNLKIDKTTGTNNGDKTIYKGTSGTELIVEEKDAGHEFPKEEIPDMVTFLKNQKHN